MPVKSLRGSDRGYPPYPSCLGSRGVTMRPAPSLPLEVDWQARGRRALLGAFATCMLLCAAARALAEDLPSGTWRGPWYLGMTSGTAELRIDGESGTRRGFLRMTNNESFGAAALPLSSLEVDGGALRFKVTGEDGRTLSAEFPLDSANPTSLKGFARYGGHRLRFEFSRSTMP